MKQMRIIALLLTAFAVGQSSAQDITQYRYWYNDDVANAVTQTVGETPELALATTLPTGTMEPGFHRITMQFNDGQNWSAPLTQVFKRSSSAITGYRYWFNDDPSTLTTASVTPNATVHLNDLLSTIPTESHYNRVTMQFMDADGEYSAPITRTYVRGVGPVSGYEYWIDDDIAGRTSGNVGPANVVDLIADLPTNTIPGEHLFTIRFKGDPDGWSVPLTTEYSFVVGLEELPGLSDLLLFPNPTDGQLVLRLSTTEAQQLKLTVLDATGRVVRAEENWTANGTAMRTWDLADLPAGTYGLLIRREGHQVMLPFAKR